LLGSPTTLSVPYASDKHKRRLRKARPNGHQTAPMVAHMRRCRTYVARARIASQVQESPGQGAW